MLPQANEIKFIPFALKPHLDGAFFDREGGEAYGERTSVLATLQGGNA